MGGGRLGRAAKQQDGHPHGAPPPPVELFRMAPETTHTRTERERERETDRQHKTKKKNSFSNYKEEKKKKNQPTKMYDIFYLSILFHPVKSLRLDAFTRKREQGKRDCDRGGADRQMSAIG